MRSFVSFKFHAWSLPGIGLFSGFVLALRDSTFQQPGEEEDVVTSAQRAAVKFMRKTETGGACS